MADATINNRRSGQAPRRGSPHRISTHIDRTPVVEPGFLLITFFIFSKAFVRYPAGGLQLVGQAEQVAAAYRK